MVGSVLGVCWLKMVEVKAVGSLSSTASLSFCWVLFHGAQLRGCANGHARPTPQVWTLGDPLDRSRLCCMVEGGARVEGELCWVVLSDCFILGQIGSVCFYL